MKLIISIAIPCLCLCSPVIAQGASNLPGIKRKKDPIPRELDSIYQKGLKYLKSTQNKDGSWSNDSSSYGRYPGVVALGLLSFLACGEDPNHGPYALNIKQCINYLLKLQQQNGYIGSLTKSDNRGNMYNHGFATLALAEAYGMVELSLIHI